MTTDKTRGLLCIWTDVDLQHDLDFNRWYDREHMQERVAIPGFQSARRFGAIGSSQRPYLALYYTDSLDVFRSDAYCTAFGNQSDWSLENFKRMRGTQRRVGKLSVEAGAGEGGALALFVLPPDRLGQSDDKLREALATVAGQDYVISASLLETDAGLSTPVTADAVASPADGLVMVEATHAAVAVAQATALAELLGMPAAGVHSFQSLWRLGA
jgi:hypothetical protein